MTMYYSNKTFITWSATWSYYCRWIIQVISQKYYASCIMYT